MKTMKLVTLVLALVISVFAVASDDHAVTAISGYDPVAYFQQNAAVRGSGFHTAVHAGETYLFSSEKNKEEFKKNPSKYVPQFGGFCAFGVSLGKKFYADPTVFAVVNNKLYLNLDKDIQAKWNAEQSKMIKDADVAWKKISSKEVGSL